MNIILLSLEVEGQRPTPDLDQLELPMLAVYVSLFILVIQVLRKSSKAVFGIAQMGPPGDGG